MCIVYGVYNLFVFPEWKHSPCPCCRLLLFFVLFMKKEDNGMRLCFCVFLILVRPEVSACCKGVISFQCHHMLAQHETLLPSKHQCRLNFNESLYMRSILVVKNIYISQSCSVRLKSALWADRSYGFFLLVQQQTVVYCCLFVFSSLFLGNQTIRAYQTVRAKIFIASDCL